MRNLFQISFPFLIFLAGCQSAPTLSCDGTNWYELGRQQGRAGKEALSAGELKSSCGKSDIEEALTLMVSGFQNGNAEFCSTSNAFILGRLDLELPRACPSESHSEFVVAYENGARYRQVESLRRDLDVRLKGIGEEIQSGGLSLAKRGLLEGERLQVLEEKERLSKDMELLAK